MRNRDPFTIMTEVFVLLASVAMLSYGVYEHEMGVPRQSAVLSQHINGTYAENLRKMGVKKLSIERPYKGLWGSSVGSACATFSDDMTTCFDHPDWHLPNMVIAPARQGMGWRLKIAHLNKAVTNVESAETSIDQELPPIMERLVNRHINKLSWKGKASSSPSQPSARASRTNAPQS